MKGLTGAHFTNGLWAHDPNLVKRHVAFPWNLVTWSGHNFAHAMTALLSWHVQICDLIESLELTSGQYKSSQGLNYEFMNDLLNESMVLFCRGIFPVLSHGSCLIHDPKGIVHGERSETNDPSCCDFVLRDFNYQLMAYSDSGSTTVTLSWGTLIINLWHIVTLEVLQGLGYRTLSQYKDSISSFGIHIIKTRQSWGNLMFIMEIPMLVTWNICTEMGTLRHENWFKGK